MPLLPTQILWINLISDGLPGLALAAEPEEKDVMRRAPAAAATEGKRVRAWPRRTRHLGRRPDGCPQHRHGGLGDRLDVAAWQTMVFTVVCFSQLAHVLAIRSERESLLSQGLLSNVPLLGAVLVTAGLQLGAIYLDPLNRALKTQPLDPTELAVCTATASVILFAVEAEKWVRRRSRAEAH
jgi:Ca2+-transporting ATPase